MKTVISKLNKYHKESWLELNDTYGVTSKK